MKRLLLGLVISFATSVALAKDGGNGVVHKSGDWCKLKNGSKGILELTKDGGNGAKDGGNGLQCVPIDDPNGSWPNSIPLLFNLKDHLSQIILFMDDNVLRQIIDSTPPE